MTDNEIIKALECCMKICEDCENCPCINNNDYTSVWDCKGALSKSILDLINRQDALIDKLEKVEHYADKTIATLNAENENLIAEIERLQSMNQAKLDTIHDLQAENAQWKEEANRYQNLWCEAEKDIQTVKAEAYKEFAERLKEKASKMELTCSGALLRRDYTIDEKTLADLVARVGNPVPPKRGMRK